MAQLQVIGGLTADKRVIPVKVQADGTLVTAASILLPPVLTIAGNVSVDNFPASQTVDGTIDVGNFPATQAVSGNVSVNNLPASQTVDGTVNVGNFPTLLPSQSLEQFPTETALTSPGQTPGRNVTGKTIVTCFFQVTGISGIVRVQLEGTNGLGFGNLAPNNLPTFITQNGTYSISVAKIALSEARFNFVSGTASITAKLSAI